EKIHAENSPHFEAVTDFRRSFVRPGFNFEYGNLSLAKRECTGSKIINRNHRANLTIYSRIKRNMVFVCGLLQMRSASNCGVDDREQESRIKAPPRLYAVYSDWDKKVVLSIANHVDGNARAGNAAVAGD